MAYQNYAGAWLPESVVGPNISGSTPNTTVYGPNQNNSWGVTGDGDTLVGGAHDDYYWLTNPGQIPVEAANGGVDTVRIWQNYVLPQNIENLIVFGDGQYGIGNSGDNVIQALGKNNVLYGGLGDDVFVGSGTGTTFVVSHGEGDKAIQNFNTAVDTVRLVGSNLTTFAQVQAAMTQQGADVVLNDAGTHLVFRNTTIGAFQARDFALPLDYAKLGAQTFSEDFDSASTIGTKWNPYFGTGGIDGYTLRNNGEKEIYTNPGFTGTGSTPLGLNPFSFNGGVMTISATPVTAAQSSQMWGYDYSSGMLESNFTQTYGYFEMRAELPKGQGLWPAFWLLGDSNKEIDVLEALGTDTRQPDFALHTPSISPGYSFHGFNPYADGMHTYGLMWDPQHLTYYVDGTPVWQTDTPSDANSPMHLIVNLAVGGNWPGSPDASTPWPAQMKIDYIRAYNLPGDGTNTGETAPPVDTGGGTTSGGGGTSTGGTGSGGTSTGGTGPGGTGAGGSTGQSLTATHIGSVLAGGTGADTLTASQADDTLTGGAGADHFVLPSEPWSPIHITDFQVGTDVLDLSALLAKAGYTGADPIADHYVYLTSDGAGGTLVRFDHDGSGPSPQWPNTIVDLQGVSPTGLTWSQLEGGAASSGGGGASTGGGSGSTTGGGGTTSAGGGQTLTATQIGSVLTGGAAADTLTASQANDTLTGGAGADHFVLSSEPWSPIHITDFQVGSDVLDLSALFKAAGYAGTDPVADHYIYLVSDGSGGTIVRFDHDGSGPSPVWPNTIVDLEHVSAAGLTWAQLQGGTASSGGGATTGGSGSTGGAAGLTLTASAPNSVLTGGAGADTITASQGYDTLTGGAGADHFVLASEPWAPIHIADFQPGQDKLDLSALFRAAGYTGSDPVADRYIYVLSDGNGGSIIRYDHDGSGSSPVWPNTIIDLEHVAPAQVTSADWIIH